MFNITTKVANKKLTIEIDLSVEPQPSNSGKRLLLASSEGNAAVPGTDGLELGLNLMQKPKGK